MSLQSTWYYRVTELDFDSIPTLQDVTEVVKELVQSKVNRLWPRNTQPHHQEFDTFTKPVAEWVKYDPDYLTKIKHPQDLSTIYARLLKEDEEYRNDLAKVFKDMNLVWRNAVDYFEE